MRSARSGLQSSTIHRRSSQRGMGRSTKHNRRTLKRLMDDVTTQVGGTEYLAEYAVLTKQKKRIETVLAVLDFTAKSGIVHTGLVDLVKSQRHYLSIEPAAELEFPRYIAGSVFLLSVRMSGNAETFWAGVKEASAIFDGETLAKKQSNVVAERLISIIKSSDMYSMMSPFFPKDIGCLGLTGELHQHVEYASCICWCTDMGTKELSDLREKLSAAVESTKDTKHIIPNALTVFPAGRVLSANAEYFNRRLDLTFVEVDRISALLTESLHILQSSASSGKASLALVDNAVLDAERKDILKQHFTNLLCPKVRDGAQLFAKQCLDSFRYLLGPLLDGTKSCEGWLASAELQDFHKFCDEGFLGYQCILQAHWCDDCLTQPVRQASHIASALVKVHSHIQHEGEELLLAECATIHSSITVGFGLCEAMASSFGEDFVEKLRLYENEKFSPPGAAGEREGPP